MPGSENMNIWTKGSATVITGDALEVLRGLETGSAHCCITSPPYYGLRDYGHPGQYGLEDTPEAYVARMVEVFAEVRRVLRIDGTLWLNIGDSYNSRLNGSPNGIGRLYGQTMDDPGYDRPCRAATTLTRRVFPGLKPKELMGIPWRVAFAIQDAGWFLRQDIIWHKPNPLPESVRDRCTKAHEYLFLLSRSPQYYFDHEAIREKASVGDHPHLNRTRNKRSVWTVPTYPYPKAHFATFPPKLIEPCILAGCPEGGVVLDPFCGSGTSGAVAVELGRRFIGVELNPEYVELAKERIEPALMKGSGGPLFAAQWMG